jgi:phosphatidylinositol glycan class K
MIVDTCQAITLPERVYSPNVFYVGSSLKGQNAYAIHSDPSLGTALGDRMTYYMLEFFETVHRESNATLKDLVRTPRPRFFVGIFWAIFVTNAFTCNW